jgi:uncharacterized membrane protein
VSLSPLLQASPLVQAHVAFGLVALALGVLRVAWPHAERADRALGWSFLAALLATAGTAVLLARPSGTPDVLGFTVGHLFIFATGAGVIAALWAARRRDRLGWRNIVTALFAGVLVMAGLFEVMPGRLMNTILAGG